MSNPGRGRKPLIDHGKELRGLLKSIIRLRLIVIGPPATSLACEGAASRNIRPGPHESPNNPCGMGLTTPLPRQSTWNRFPAVWSWQPRELCAVSSALDACSREVGPDRPEDQHHPVLISLCSHLGHYIQNCFEGHDLDTEDKSTQSEIFKGLSRPVTPVSRI